MSTVEATAVPAVKPEEVTKATDGNSGVKSFLAGGLGGMCLVAAGHPLDLLKVRMQTSSEYKSTFDCFRKTLAENGIRGMYRGMAAPLVGATPVFAICFWGYDMGQKIMRSAYNMSPTDKLSTNQILFAGAFSAIPTTAVMAPVERIKCVLQVASANGSGTAYKGPADAALSIVRAGGITSLFKGTCATLLRDIPGSVAYFGAYEFIKKALTGNNAGEGPISPLAIVTAGGLAGMATWTVAIPPDVLKSRLQTAPEGRYSGVRQVFVEMMRTEGPGALFRGVGPALLRAFPANAACFLGVEVSLQLMNKVW
ncbi:putative mitochondrial carnitine/acylcarnitine carrier protein [Coemansia reversa NRRL 1564]|uniref:Putative mitochondrial carnitine/acylcarnitine carrier protein n=1 Tax=Coemansia reversa (strain ATCC 12441 / NRRL 1564) TaxID=763665 RepID=A0A2G5BA59_COERN|nr:putative mitochondrial carnitine/acylcarnitine carrier protein [Coemansia reversa NRRL 1564]|eukprot:PIA15893.1 putative mitochondrial carnitine/acylcarnitine carrier protein [Coemansia reversa NRRL 1564]